jgi:ligand-binding SRPBCC domain-containing protein
LHDEARPHSDRTGGGVTAFKTSVRITRPIEDVFAFVSDPLNFPHWNSAVQAVWKTRGQASEVGSTYTMQRELPSGSVENELEIFAREHPTDFGIRTRSGPTPFSYRYGFSAANGQTIVQLDAVVELDGAAALLGRLAGRAIKRGVDNNLAELERILGHG